MTEFSISKGSKGGHPLEVSTPCGASLESILCTEELRRRPLRPAEFDKENSALVSLASALADSPGTILQTLADKVLEVLQADSAGLSLLTKDEKRFYWAAIAGAWSPHIGGGTQRAFGPCGDVLDRNIPLLFTHWERRYPYLGTAVPLAEEGLLVPFYVNGKAVGTIWAIAHDKRRQFDTEDLRLLESMGRFASAAYQAVESIDNLKFEIAQREKAETALLGLNNDLEARVRVRTEELEERNAAARQATASLQAAFQQIEVLKDQLYKENIALREEIDQTSMFEEIVGTAPPLKEVLARVSKVAPTDSIVLITGETGTGKELIARAIHKRSARASRVFVSVNCAGIPPALVASELFGHEKGSFTGALQRRIGRFELAEGGTIFLDEVGELPAETQIALLRVLQEKEFERVGGGRPVRADVRLIAATNRDLKAAIASGSFRSDLFYRLNVFPIEMPSLRARKDDIPLLAEYFIHRYAGKMGKRFSSISKESLEMLQSYTWPGNIRQLQNVIERSVIICETGTLTIDESWVAGKALENSNSIQPLPQKLAEDEKSRIEAALAEARGRVSGPSGAAVKLGMPASTLESKIRALKINKHSFKAAA